MTNVVCGQGRSAISEQGFSVAARGVHDGVYGFLKGIAVTVVNRVEPYVKPFETKGRELYAENFRSINAGGFLVGIGSLYCAPWNVVVMGVGVAGVGVIGRLTKQPCDTAQAEPHTASDQQGVIASSSSLSVTTPATGSLPKTRLALPENTQETSSESRAVEVATRMVEQFGCILKNVLLLVELADIITEENSATEIVKLFDKDHRTFSPEVKAKELVELRKEMKAMIFVDLLRAQVTHKDIANTVFNLLHYRSDQRKLCLSSICKSQDVDYKKVAENFLIYANDSELGQRLIKDSATQVFLLELLTKGWAPQDMECGPEKDLDSLIFNHCKELKKSVLKK